MSPLLAKQKPAMEHTPSFSRCHSKGAGLSALGAQGPEGKPGAFRRLTPSAAESSCKTVAPVGSNGGAVTFGLAVQERFLKYDRLV